MKELLKTASPATLVILLLAGPTANAAPQIPEVGQTSKYECFRNGRSEVNYLLSKQNHVLDFHLGMMTHTAEDRRGS